jgi:excinuclease ABC subunit C
LSPKQSEGSEAYKQNLRKLISYIKGNRVALTRELESAMRAAAAHQDFEKAAELRNRLNHMQELKRRVMFGDREFMDISKDKALSDLTALLGLRDVPKRIEGYDISHMGGTNVVASMVVFTNGVSNRGEYRKFKTRLEHNNDTYNMHETLSRRFSEKNIKSWGMPDLVLIDGGKGQLDAALKAMEERSVAVPTISIAKREEEIIIHSSRSNIPEAALNALRHMTVPGVGVFDEGAYTVVNLHIGQRNAGAHSKNLGGGMSVSPYADITKLFQRIRDESHRFAVSYHSVLKQKKQTASVLEDIPGIGPETRKKLIRTFGSVRSMSDRDVSDIAAVVGKAKAERIHAYLQRL